MGVGLASQPFLHRPHSQTGQGLVTFVETERASAAPPSEPLSERAQHLCNYPSQTP